MTKKQSKQVVELMIFLMGIVLLDPHGPWQLFVAGLSLIGVAFWIRFKVKDAA